MTTWAQYLRTNDHMSIITFIDSESICHFLDLLLSSLICNMYENSQNVTYKCLQILDKYFDQFIKLLNSD